MFRYLELQEKTLLITLQFEKQTAALERAQAAAVEAQHQVEGARAVQATAARGKELLKDLEALKGTLAAKDSELGEVSLTSRPVITFNISPHDPATTALPPQVRSHLQTEVRGRSRSTAELKMCRNEIANLKEQIKVQQTQMRTVKRQAVHDRQLLDKLRKVRAEEQRVLAQSSAKIGMLERAFNQFDGANGNGGSSDQMPPEPTTPPSSWKVEDRTGKRGGVAAASGKDDPARIIGGWDALQVLRLLEIATDEAMLQRSMFDSKQGMGPSTPFAGGGPRVEGEREGEMSMAEMHADLMNTTIGGSTVGGAEMGETLTSLADISTH